MGYQPEKIIRIEELDSKVSLDLIRTRLSQNKCDDAELGSFASILGHIPFALTQACAYIEANELMTVSRYCARFRETEDMQQRLLGKASYDLRRDPDIHDAVTTTWQISFEHLKFRNPFTADVLSFPGVFDRQHIPKFLVYVLDEDQLKVDEALNQLLAFCLIRVEADDDYLEIHHLVDTTLQFWMKQQKKQSHWLRFAMLVFLHVFPRDLLNNVEQWALGTYYFLTRRR